MSVFSQVFKFETRDNSNGGSRGLFDWFGFGAPGSLSANGKTAFTLSAFYNGVEQLSNDIAKLPKFVFRKNGTERNKFSEHPVNYLISSKPNDLMNAFDFWKIIVITVIVKGNAYAEVIRNSVTGFPEEIIYHECVDVTPLRSGNKIYYRIKGRMLSSSDMLHFKGFSFDGITGIGVIQFAAAQLGVSLEAQKYNGQVYKDRGISFGVIESDAAITNDNKKAISAGFTEKLSSGNVHRAPVLDSGLKYKTISVTPAEAMFLETNKQGIIEVCRWLNIAPHKLKDLTNANYSNIYQQSIEHVQDSILPWVVRFEQELNNKLFAREDSDSLYTKFNIASLLRGDLEMLRNFYSTMVYAGIYTRNEVRALEDKNPIDGLDEPLQPVNMQALSVAMQLIKEQENDKDKN